VGGLGSHVTTADAVVNGSLVHAPVATETLTLTCPACVQVKVVDAVLVLAKVPAPVCPGASLCVQLMVGLPPTVATLTAVLEPTWTFEGFTVTDVMPGHTVGVPASRATLASTDTEPMPTGAGATPPPMKHVIPSPTPVVEPAEIEKVLEPEHGSPFVSVAVSCNV
jgi:hypothetical protein